MKHPALAGQVANDELDILAVRPHACMIGRARHLRQRPPPADRLGCMLARRQWLPVSRGTGRGGSGSEPHPTNRQDRGRLKIRRADVQKL